MVVTYTLRQTYLFVKLVVERIELAAIPEAVAEDVATCAAGRGPVDALVEVAAACVNQGRATCHGRQRTQWITFDKYKL